MIRNVVEGLVSLLRTRLIEPLAGLDTGHAASASRSLIESLECRQLLSAAVVDDWSAAAAYAPAAVAATTTATPARATSAAVLRKASPIQLKAEAASATQVKLFWGQPNIKATRIDIYARASDSGLWMRVGHVSPAKKGFTANRLAPEQRHEFQVRAVSAKGAGHASQIAAATTRPVSASKSPSPTAKMGQPIVITKGGTYTGNWGSNDANTPAVRIATSEPVIIENAIIRSRGSLIEAFGQSVNLTVRNTQGYGLNPNLAGRYPGRFINLEGFTSLTVENNYMEGTSGIYLYKYVGNRTPQQTIKVLRNVAKNIDGRYSDGKNGFLKGSDDHYLVQFFQMNGIKNLPGVEVAWNQVINEPGKSRVEDNINIFASSGTPASPMRIHNNYVQGAYPYDAAGDNGFTGGGIMLSDVGTAYVHAYNNQVLATTNYGIAISAGHDNRFYNNRIISAGLLPNGKPAASQNVGAYIWNMHNEPNFARNTGDGNLIGWNHPTGRNDWWTPDAAGWTNNTAFEGTITLATEAAEFQLWLKKCADAGIKLGPAS